MQRTGTSASCDPKLWLKPGLDSFGPSVPDIRPLFSLKGSQSSTADRVWAQPFMGTFDRYWKKPMLEPPFVVGRPRITSGAGHQFLEYPHHVQMGDYEGLPPEPTSPATFLCIVRVAHPESSICLTLYLNWYAIAHFRHTGRRRILGGIVDHVIQRSESPLS